MIFFPKLSLWRAVSKEIKGRISKDMRSVLKNFKAILSSSIVDLADVLSKAPFSTWAGTSDLIENKKAKSKIAIKSTYLPNLQNSGAISASFEQKLRANNALMAAINAMKLSPKDEKDLLANYAKTFTKHAIVNALEDLRRNDTKIAAGMIVLEVVWNEPYPSHGVAGYYDMVKLSDGKDLKKERTYWRNRNTSQYNYVRNLAGKKV